MTNKELSKKLKEYSKVRGISRYEDDVVELLRNNTSESGFEYSRDGLGSLIMRNPGKGPKIQITAHMDEVGFLVSDITEKGFLKLFMVGGIWTSSVIGTKASVFSEDGKEYFGVFGHTSIHIMTPEQRAKTPTLNNMYVDLGLKSKSEVESLGIGIGSQVHLNADYFETANPDYVVGKAIDDRAGVVVIETVVNNLRGIDTPNDLYIVGTVQEEVGTRGAVTSVSKIKPDIAIAIDTTTSHDTPGTPHGINNLDCGVALRINDLGTMMDPKLINFIFNTAKKHNIKAYKFIPKGGGTDASKLQYGENGVPVITLSIPQRYLHSPHGLISLNDIQETIKLVTSICKTLGQKEYNIIKYI
ncbi:MAG: M42 family metallopeptidase [Mollicutes bacterium PWAP]|nr:M42 family metallopeptidase [Mollicutes bacterium PWAP]